jgi:hypothetical protein
MTRYPVAKTRTVYQVEIPEVITRNPEQAVIDGITCIYERGGIPMVEAVLEAVMEVVYPSVKR